jgi:hypothetical protein
VRRTTHAKPSAAAIAAARSWPRRSSTIVAIAVAAAARAHQVACQPFGS